MNFVDALRTYDKITNDGGKTYYFYNEKKLWLCTGENMGEVDLTFELVFDDGWEEYIPPEKNKDKEQYMVSDGFGEFVYVYPSEDDDNFITIQMENENEYKYDKMKVDLYKDDVKELINYLIKLL